MTIGGANSGAIVFAAGFTPKSPIGDVRVLVQALDDGGAVEVFVTTRLCLRIVIRRADGDKIDSAETCPIVAPGLDKIAVAATWRDGRITRIVVNGLVCFSSEPEFVAPQNIGVSTRLTSTIQPKDFSVENASALQKRVAKLANHSRNPARIAGGKEYVFDSLADEVYQLNDLLNFVREGKQYHVRGLMSRVRTLLIGRDPLGLLQMASAFTNSSLIIYTSTNPEMPIHPEPDMQFKLSARSFDATPFTNPIDIDVWLKTIGAVFKKIEYTHDKLIRDIGNTYASHLDIDIQPSVFFLRSGKQDHTIEMENLTRYSILIGDMCLSLGQRLLSEKNGN